MGKAINFPQQSKDEPKTMLDYFIALNEYIRALTVWGAEDRRHGCEGIAMDYFTSVARKLKLLAHGKKEEERLAELFNSAYQDGYASSELSIIPCEVKQLEG